jgi:hypothetical protein
MSTSSRPRSRLALVAATVATLLIVTTGAVAADTGPGGDGTFTQNGKSADVQSSECLSNGDGTVTCSMIGLSGFLGKLSDSVTGVTHANQVCAWLGVYTFDEETGEIVGEPSQESGCVVDLPSGALRFGTNLDWATLAATTVAVQTITCDEKPECELGPPRDIIVEGTWTGIGPIYGSKFHYSSDDGTCRSYQSGKGSNREASFAGSIDGLSPAGDTWAMLNDGKFTYRSRCIEV